MPSEERERIFAPFYQVGSSLRRSHGGMGLGLSLARRMVQTQGGRLWLERGLAPAHPSAWPCRWRPKNPPARADEISPDAAPPGLDAPADWRPDLDQCGAVRDSARFGLPGQRPPSPQIGFPALTLPSAIWQARPCAWRSCAGRRGC
ncbi:MAG: hypothetical protein IPO34_18145 [Dehalococcoidia bacterium]|nr:hypothetical protein [Dehalococcoidia bacterium]